MTEQNEIIRPRLSQLELFIIVDLLKDQCANRKTVQSQTPYSKQVRRLRRKLKRNLKINHANYDVTSNRVPYVKTEQQEAEPKETSALIEDGWSDNNKFLAFKY